MKQSARILIVDDDSDLCSILADVLSKAGYKTDTAGSGHAALESLQSCRYPVMLLDLLLPGYSGIEVLERVLNQYPSTVVIMMSGHGTIQSAMEATRLGAFDWLEKPLKKERVLITVANALKISKVSRQKELLLEEARQRYAMIGVSPQIKHIFDLIDKVARTDTSVMITGESGTGKELVARAIHMQSPRAGNAFVEVNCAAVPETLIESELFGHMKGAFTGAISSKRGKFQLAHEGTLFLDEVGELSQAAQAKLLRVLENGEITPVGGERSRQVHTRIVAATNKNLPEEVRNGTFREDLFHRINVVDIVLPPLRIRQEDIMPLLEHFISRFTREYKMPAKHFLPDAAAVIHSHDWPGNVRELKNFAEKLMVLIPDSDIRASHVSKILHGRLQENQPAEAQHTDLRTYQEAKESFEKNYLRTALINCKWNVAEAAETIDMPKSLLYKKIEKYGLKG